VAGRIDHKLLDKFLGYVLDRHKDGEMSKSSAIGALAHLVAAMDLPEGEGSDPTHYMKAVITGALEDE
jgi:hypothetical protein